MNLGLLVVRVVVGLLFVGHGTQKLFGWFGGHGREGTGQFFDAIGLKPGRHHALAAGVTEALGGLMLALGLVTPLAAAGLTAVMGAAIWTAHRANGVWASNGGFEYNLVLAAIAFAITGVGAGAWSLDHVLSLDVDGTGWALAELAAGILGATAAVISGRLVASRSDSTAGSQVSPA
jgi:putative oxidoreductase